MSEEALSSSASHPRLEDPRANLDMDRLNEYSILESKGYGSRRLTTPPSYAKPFPEIYWFQDSSFTESEWNWLILGADYRIRYEYRENDFRRSSLDLDSPFFLRTRGFLAIQEVLDPIRFTLEMEDAQKIQSLYPTDDREENRVEPIQGYLEIYFKKVPLLDKKPVSLRTGRMAFELMDRRLVAMNEWRNTTNTFQGSRLIIGNDSMNWNLDSFFLQPIKREVDKLDVPEERQYFSGSVATYKYLPASVAFQAFGFLLQQSELSEVQFSRTSGSSDSSESSDSSDSGIGKISKTVLRPGRRFQTTGLRVFGQVPGTGFDYDTSASFQYGTSDMGKGIPINARSGIIDIGYSWKNSYKPRLGGLYGVATGNRDPNRGEQNRFERLYGFARPWSMHDYITFENTKTAKLVLEFSPSKDTRIDTAFNRYWLYSPFDRWERATLIDKTGNSGTHLGDEWNIRWITKIDPAFIVNIGYALFHPGEFTVKKTSRDLNSHFYYIEISTMLL